MNKVTDLSSWTDEPGVDVGATSPGRLVGFDVSCWSTQRLASLSPQLQQVTPAATLDISYSGYERYDLPCVT